MLFRHLTRVLSVIYALSKHTRFLGYCIFRCLNCLEGDRTSVDWRLDIVPRYRYRRRIWLIISAFLSTISHALECRIIGHLRVKQVSLWLFDRASLELHHNRRTTILLPIESVEILIYSWCLCLWMKKMIRDLAPRFAHIDTVAAFHLADRLVKIGAWTTMAHRSVV